jgi:hypothetical protein
MQLCLPIVQAQINELPSQIGLADHVEPLLVVVIKDSPQPHSPLELGFMNTNSDLQDSVLLHNICKTSNKYVRKKHT